MHPVHFRLIGAGVSDRPPIDRIGRDPHLTLAGIADPSAARHAAPWTSSAPLQATLAVAEAARSSQAVSCTLPG